LSLPVRPGLSLDVRAEIDNSLASLADSGLRHIMQAGGHHQLDRRKDPADEVRTARPDILLRGVDEPL